MGGARRDGAPRQPIDDLEAARAIALRSLSHAPKSRAELAKALAGKGVVPEVAEELLDRLAGVGLVDDAQYAATIVRTRHAERGLARRAIAVELARRGISQDIASEALDQLDDADEAERAWQLAVRRAASMQQLEPAARTRRLDALLRRKGYSSGVVTQVLRSLGEAGLEADVE